MKSKISIKNSIFPLDYRNRLAEVFSKYWEEYINKEVKRKFLHKVYDNNVEIKKCRLFLDLPKEGYPHKKDYVNWVLENRKRKRPKLIKYRCLEEITEYKCLGLNLYNPKVSTESSKKKNLKKKLISFDAYCREVITELARKIKLDMNWYYQFENYVLTGNEDMRLITDCGIKIIKKVFIRPNDKLFDGKILLELGANTTFDDLKLVWDNQIKPLLETLPSRIIIPSHYKPKKPV